GRSRRWRRSHTRAAGTRYWRRCESYFGWRSEHPLSRSARRRLFGGLQRLRLRWDKEPKQEGPGPRGERERHEPPQLHQPRRPPAVWGLEEGAEEPEAEQHAGAEGDAAQPPGEEPPPPICEHTPDDTAQRARDQDERPGGGRLRNVDPVEKPYRGDEH